jgi:CHAD domain-containing protein
MSHSIIVQLPESPSPDDLAVDPTAPGAPTNGDQALELVKRLIARLTALHAPVLADEDPEPLHQMRVTMRRLRTVLRQFAPALDLPSSVTERRIARVGRRLGLARDLDVLRELLIEQLQPHLPEAETRRLRPLLKQMGRERAIAYESLEQTLRGSSYLGLMARLQRWQKRPRFTPLGRQPLRAWLVEWQAPQLASLFAHPGWFVPGPKDDPETVHDLRKRCKEARYSLENLEDQMGPACRRWARCFKRVQQILGDLNDLRVLRDAIEDQLPGRLRKNLPHLDALLKQRTAERWSEWRDLAEEVQCPARRHALLQDLLSEAGVQPVRARLRLARRRKAGRATPLLMTS